MLVTTEGIVLKQRKIANNRRMLVLFTRNYGKLSVGTGMNEKGRSRSALALRPFTYADYELFKNRGYYNLNNATVRQSFYSIGEDIDRFMTASGLISFLDATLEEEQVRQGIFDLSVEFLEALSHASGNYKTIYYAFLVKTLRMNGIMPETGRCADCGKKLAEMRETSGRIRNFSVSAGGILCDDCVTKEKNAGETLIFTSGFDIVDMFRYFMDQPLSVFGKIGLRPEAEAELRQILTEYIRYYMDTDLFDNDSVL